jgi:subtilase family serine protease
MGAKMVRFRSAIVLACAVALAWGSAASAQMFSAPRRVFISGNSYHVAACPGPVPAGYARCFAHIVTDRSGTPLRNRMAANRFEKEITSNLVPDGWGPRGLIAAYNPQVAYTYPFAVGKSSTIIAIVDAFGYPNAEADLAFYRKLYSLPACTTANGCFKKLNEWGAAANYPAANAGWADETALDLDMASAMCPQCKIILVEAANSSSANLGTAVDTAVKKGAHVVSNSYGGPEAGSASFNPYYNHPGVAITVSTGDDGYDDWTAAAPNTPNFPATSQFVTAVGGTSLYFSEATGFFQTAWLSDGGGGGSGCSTIYPKPSWQKDTLCKKRMEADVSAVGDPNTGVAVYGPCGTTCSAGSQFTPGWSVYGGTSVAAPLVGGIYAANGGTVTLGSPYAAGVHLTDVKAGTNGNTTTGSPGNCGGTYYCVAGVGYDGPTGMGTPLGEAGF